MADARELSVLKRRIHELAKELNEVGVEEKTYKHFLVYGIKFKLNLQAAVILPSKYMCKDVFNAERLRLSKLRQQHMTQIQLEQAKLDVLSREISNLSRNVSLNQHKISMVHHAAVPVHEKIFELCHSMGAVEHHLYCLHSKIPVDIKEFYLYIVPRMEELMQLREQCADWRLKHGYFLEQ